MAFYLDPVTADTGCLNIIPGSHHLPFHDGLDKARHTGLHDLMSPDVPGCYALESEPVDLCVFRHALFHSSFGGWAGRRMLSIHYFNPTSEWHSSFVEGQTEGRLPYMKAGHRVYSDYLVQTADPRRMKRLRRYIDKGYCDQSQKPLTDRLLSVHQLPQPMVSRRPAHSRVWWPGPDSSSGDGIGQGQSELPPFRFSDRV